ncbi:MAG: hypothetical protein WC683_04790 [bacterium]
MTEAIAESIEETLEKSADIDDELPAVFETFIKYFLEISGIHLLGIGQTYSGKTQKAYQFAAWLMEFDETICWIDSGKSIEINPLIDIAADFNLPVKVIIPAGCKLSIEHETVPVTVEEVKNPKKIPLMIERDHVNILSIHQFFFQDRTYARYMSEFTTSLLYHARLQNLDTDRLAILADEFGILCPGNEMQKQSKSLGRTASLVAGNMKQIRSCGVRYVCFDQAWTGVYPPARSQFPFYLICRSPGIPRNAGTMGRYNFENLMVDEGYLVFPQRRWDLKWEFPFFKMNPKTKIKASGLASYKNNRKEFEIDDDDEL